MPKRVAVKTLNATTLDVLNTIRANASAEYQQLVPQVEVESDIPKVGEVLYGYPAMANQFISTLMNRIALVRVQSATFNNRYANLKKGYLNYGETVEEVFVQITKAREFSVEKAEAREFKRSLPDVRTAMHIMNYRVQYPITIQDEDLRMAFTSADGVTNLINKIVDAVYTGAEYDEFLLFKYLLIKSISHGKMKKIVYDQTDIKKAGVTFRGVSNLLTFMSQDYNEQRVTTTTPKSDQIIFMDAMFNAQYDVDVLAAAFNMDKATYQGSLYLIDNWTSFDNDRFSVIQQGTDCLPPVTDEELSKMYAVKAVLLDKEWFQVYDNQNKMTEKYVASGQYWNYFYNVWKTVSYSPFSNAVAFVDAPDTDLTDITLEVTSVDKSDEALTITLVPQEQINLNTQHIEFVQDEACTTAGIAVHKFGAYLFPKSAMATAVDVHILVNGKPFKSSTQLDPSTAKPGDTLTCTTEE